MSKESVLKWLGEQQEHHDNETQKLVEAPPRIIHVLPNTSTLDGPKSYTLQDVYDEITKETPMGKKFQKAIENHLSKRRG